MHSTSGWVGAVNGFPLQNHANRMIFAHVSNDSHFIMKIPTHLFTRPTSAKKTDKIGTNTAVPETKAVQSAKAVQDIVSIAGIPEKELTTSVRKALTSLIEEVNSLRGQVGQLQDQLSQAEKVADLDPLLEVSNRRAFVRDLNRVLAMAKRYNTQAALVFIDLNNLKILNDEHSHKTGDRALKHVATLFSANIRAEDSFARIGGDEFGLILMNSPKIKAQQKMSELSSLIQSTPLKGDHHDIKLGIAYGIVDITGGLSAGEALENADKEMYKDKIRNRTF